MKKFFKAQLQLSGNDALLFLKRLAFLLQAGISVHSSIEIIEKQSKNNAQALYSRIRDDLNNGKSLSQSLAVFSKTFPSYSTEMIRAGEESGKLAEYLLILSDELQRKKAMQQKLISSLIYPIVIAFGTIALSLFLVFTIFPKLKSLFKSLRATLPLSTRIMIWLTDTLHYYGVYIFLFLLVLAGAFFILWRKNNTFKQMCTALLRRSPLVGTLIKNYCLIVFFRTVGMMLGSSITLEKSLHHAGAAISQSEYRQAITEATQKITHGSTLALSLKKFPELFPQAALQMIEIGEASGTLSETCLYVSQMTEQDNEMRIKTLLNLIEPLLMIGMGLVVGFIALSMIIPIYGITQNLKH